MKHLKNFAVTLQYVLPMSGCVNQIKESLCFISESCFTVLGAHGSLMSWLLLKILRALELPVDLLHWDPGLCSGSIRWSQPGI